MNNLALQVLSNWWLKKKKKKIPEETFKTIFNDPEDFKIKLQTWKKDNIALKI